MTIVILGLSITSSWGNGHATTYRGLMRELCARGHDVLFLERDVPYYASNRDLPAPPYGRTELYESFDDLQRFTPEVRDADLTIVGSYVPEGVAVGDWTIQTARGLKAFYDIDTPVTLAKLARGDYEYLAPHLIPRFDLYLSFSGGKSLERLENQWGSPCARPLYCSFDPELYYPDSTFDSVASILASGLKRDPYRPDFSYDLGYLGTYSPDRQPPLETLLIEPARAWPEGRFVVAGPQYPLEIVWPQNVERIEHLPPSEHRGFYNAQRFALNITRQDMIQAGHSPSVRLFEAAACATPIISDWWAGLDEFFTPNEEIFIAHSAQDVGRLLREASETARRAMGMRARERVLGRHTAAHRAQELESYALEAKT